MWGADPRRAGRQGRTVKTAALLLVLALMTGAIAPASAQTLCVDGHPAHRRANVTYGGLPPKPGAERDHVIPLSLGGADTRAIARMRALRARDNVRYQAWPAAGSGVRVIWNEIRRVSGAANTLIPPDLDETRETETILH
jgi:hypothetical protein